MYSIECRDLRIVYIEPEFEVSVYRYTTLPRAVFINETHACRLLPR